MSCHYGRPISCRCPFTDGRCTDRNSIPPSGHGPWCGCATCQACNNYNSGDAERNAVEIYKRQLKAANDALWEMQLKSLQRNRYEQEAELRDDRLLTIAALQQANVELRSRLANVERMYLGYEVTRYAPPPQMRVEREVEYRTVERPERRSPAFTLAIVGMLVALAVVSQILLWFH